MLFSPIYLDSIKKGVILDSKLYYYIVNYDAISRSKFTFKKAQDYITVIKEIHKHFKDHKYIDLVQKQIFKSAVKNIIKGTSKSDMTSEEMDIIKTELKNLYKNKVFNLSGLQLKYKILFLLNYK